MTLAIRSLAPDDVESCLGLFESNCPAFFAPNERADFAAYLAHRSSDYRLCERDGVLVAAFGVSPGVAGHAHLNWIMVDPAAQGGGIGGAIMDAAQTHARSIGADTLEIAASHLSAPFFERFGAREQARSLDGWGPGMHRIDMKLPL